MKLYLTLFSFLFIFSNSFAQFHREGFFYSNEFINKKDSSYKLSVGVNYNTGLHQGRENEFYLNIPGILTRIGYKNQLEYKKIQLEISPSIILNSINIPQKNNLKFPYSYPNIYWINYTKYIQQYDNRELSNVPKQFFSFYPGESHLKMNRSKFILKAGFHNMNFGVAPSDGLLLSRNAPGFLKLSLEGSHFNSENKSNIRSNYKIFIGAMGSPQFIYSIKNGLSGEVESQSLKNQETRYITGADYRVITSGTHHFEAGLNYLLISYLKTNLVNSRESLTGFSGFASRNMFMSSLFFKTSFEPESIQIWGEYAYRNMLINPISIFVRDTVSSAYLFGMRKIYRISDNKNIELFSQVSNMQSNTIRGVYSGSSWYTHQFLNQGATFRGILLGNGIGPGSNSFYFSTIYWNKKRAIGFNFERLMRNQDFYYSNFSDLSVLMTDYRRHWMDLSLGINYSYLKHKSANYFGFVFTKSFNHQWQVDPNQGGWKNYGIDKYGFRLTFTTRIS